MCVFSIQFNLKVPADTNYFAYVNDHCNRLCTCNTLISQGKLQMWVDIMPLDIDAYIPPPVDITPKKIEEYELRVVIYTVRDIMKAHSSSVTSNIYIRA